MGKTRDAEDEAKKKKKKKVKKKKKKKKKKNDNLWPTRSVLHIILRSKKKLNFFIFKTSLPKNIF